MNTPTNRDMDCLNVPGPTSAPSLSERLRDRTTLRFMGDCKCGNCQLVPRPLLDEAIAVTAALPKVEAALRADRKLWLWRNGDHYWAFDSLYPRRLDCNDPATLGEPVAWAILKATKHDPRDNDPAEIARAKAFSRQHHPLNAGDLYEALNDLLNDCINFDGGKLTPVFMKRASDALAKARALGIDGAAPDTERSGTPTPPASLVQS